MLVRNGMRTVQLIGVPQAGLATPEADAVVVALKSRTAPVAEAVAESLAAQRWLAGQGARQYLFKYCSTFDSTEPATSARSPTRCSTRWAPISPLSARRSPRRAVRSSRATCSSATCCCPTRTCGTTRLRPMTDANLVRVLERQTARGVGLVAFDIVRRGPDAIRARFAELRGAGCAYAVTDVIEDEDLRRLGAACSDLVLLTGGSGIAMGLPENFRAAALAAGLAADALPAVAGSRGGARRFLLGGDPGAGGGDGGGSARLRLDPERLAAGWPPGGGGTGRASSSATARC